MKRVLLLLLVLVVAEPVLAQNGAPFLAVRGQARLEVVPDLFPLAIEISDESTDTAKSQAKVEELSRTVLAKARELGLTDRDITVGVISIAPQTRYSSKSARSEFMGNRYARRIVLRFHDLEKLRQQVAAMPTGKNLEVDTEAFRFENEADVRRRLLVSAIANARATAEVMAEGIGRRLLDAHTISTTPLSISGGSYINAIDVASVESTTILTSEQIAKVPVPRDITSVALLAPGSVSKTPLALEKGSMVLNADVYIIYRLGDR